MLTFSDQELPLFEVLGRTLRIFHSHSIITRDLIDEGTITQHQCYLATTHVMATRDEIIEAIIASKYPVAKEIATINNQVEKPDEYLEYQNFRTYAKDIADSWLNK